MTEQVKDDSPEKGASYSWPIETSLHEVLEAEINTEYGGLRAQNSLSMSVHEYNGTISVSANGAGGDGSSVALQLDPATARELADGLMSAAEWAEQRADSEGNSEQ